MQGATLVPGFGLALQHEGPACTLPPGFLNEISFVEKPTGALTHSVRGVQSLRAMRYFSLINVMENLHSTGTADETVEMRKTSHGTLDW